MLEAAELTTTLTGFGFDEILTQKQPATCPCYIMVLGSSTAILQVGRCLGVRGLGRGLGEVDVQAWLCPWVKQHILQ